MTVRLRRPGLRAVFVALVILSIVPVVVLVVASALKQRDQARQAIGGEAARVGRLAALREADLIEGGRNMLSAIAEFPSVRTKQTDTCSVRLAELLPLYPRFANIGAVDPAGNLFCSAIAPSEPLNFSHRPWFQRAVASGAFSVGDYQQGRITGKPSLVFGQPVLDERGVLVGVVWAALDLNWLQQFAAQLELPGKPVVAVLDRNGTVLAWHPDPQPWTGTTVPQAVEGIARAGQRTIQATLSDGIQRLYTFTSLGAAQDAHAVVSVGIPTSVAYHDANQTLRRNLLLLAAIAAIGMVTARLAANRFILGPTRSLVAVSRQLAEGNLDSRVGPAYGPGELGDAGRAFDRMAVALETRDAALHQAAEVQQRSETKFKSLLEAAPDGMLGVDRDGIIRLMNRRAESLFGWSRDELVGRPVATLSPDVSEHFDFNGDQPSTAEELEPYGTLALTAVRRDGTSFPAEVTLAALDTEDGPLLSIGIRDVTERTESEKALARGAQQLQAVVDNAPALIWMLDREGRYVLVNRQFEAVRRVSRDEIVGMTAAEVFGDAVDEDMSARDLEPLTAGRAIEGEEVLFLDGEPHWYISLRFPLHDAAGHVYAVCGILTDVTERIEAEAQRQALAGQLQQSQRLESLGQLAGGVAHDFNNLLAVIINYSDFVLEALSDPAPAGLEELFESIRSDMQAIFRAAETAAALTRQLLIFGRRDAAHPKVLDVNNIVGTVEPLLRRTLGEDVALVLALEPGLAKVRADAGRLEQVLLNLAVNARDAMPDGGRLTVSAENVEVDGEAALEQGLDVGRWVRLTVSDTGVGMTPSVAARAFEPFFTTKPKGHGTGLGLATVFGIVGEAGGRLSLDSQPGEGTKVHVYLPAVAGDAVATTEIPGGVPPTGGGQTVMVVEDEDVMREVARRILAGNGYSVVPASDASEALRLCEDDDVEIDLILTDVVMPGLSGPDLVDRVRSVRPGLPAIYMSGYPEDFVARRHGPDDVTVIRKPFTPGVLLRHVRTAIEGA